MTIDLMLTCSGIGADVLSTGKLQVELAGANVAQLVQTLDDSQLAKLLLLVSHEVGQRAEAVV